MQFQAGCFCFYAFTYSGFRDKIDVDRLVCCAMPKKEVSKGLGLSISARQGVVVWRAVFS